MIAKLRRLDMIMLYRRSRKSRMTRSKGPRPQGK